MLKIKLVIIAGILILIFMGLVIWADNSLYNLDQKIKNQKINNFDQCEAAGYPILESYPRRCNAPGGPSFTEDIGVSPQPAEPTNPVFIAPPATKSGSNCAEKCREGLACPLDCQ